MFSRQRTIRSLIEEDGKEMYQELYTLFQNGRNLSILLFTCKLTLVASFKAGVKRCTSHEPNGMQMRKILCTRASSPSLAFDSAHMKYGV